MSKPEFGTKHVCEACGERFYDLQRSPAICFKCGAEQSPAKPRMYRPLRVSTGHGTFGRRTAPIAAEKLEPVDDLVAEDTEAAEESEIADDEDTDLDDASDIEVEIDTDDDKALG